VWWKRGRLYAIDQRRLPARLVTLELARMKQVARAIETLAVRGAPLTGITAAYGVALAALQAERQGKRGAQAAAKAIARLAATRPTARDLFSALERLERIARAPGAAAHGLHLRLLAEARAIHAGDLAASRDIASHAEAVFERPGWVLTLCNTGALATGGGGTALALICRGYQLGLVHGVYVCETRPLLQGARLTAWELSRMRVPFKLLCDSAAAALLRTGTVTAVVTGADRIARNGDMANKAGTRMLSILAQHAGVPLYVAAPHTTFDAATPSGEAIPIERRPGREVLRLGRQRIAPPGCPVYNPSFDVTEAGLIARFVTGRGVYSPGELEGGNVWS
jgi:methylthioribose-1-phosphate isomerase